MMRYSRALIALGVVFAVGCSGRNADPPARVETPAAKHSLTGSGGELALGDTYEQAKKAFPPPAGAQVTDETMSFAMLEGQGWGWQSADDSQAFEVLHRAGKVAGVAVTRAGSPAAVFQRAERKWGKPTAKADGKNAQAVSWVSGDSAGMAVFLAPPPLGPTTVLLLGSKSDLQKLGYDPDHPEVFVNQIDLSMSMAKQLEPVFKEAKRKAMEKAKADLKRKQQEGG